MCDTDVGKALWADKLALCAGSVLSDKIDEALVTVSEEYYLTLEKYTEAIAAVERTLPKEALFGEKDIICTMMGIELQKKVASGSSELKYKRRALVKQRALGNGIDPTNFESLLTVRKQRGYCEDR